MTRSTGMALALLAALLMNGCTAIRVAKTAKKGVTEDTEITITVKGDQIRLASLEVDLRGFDVQAYVDAVETGITVVRLVGAYVEIMKTLDWLASQGLLLLAHDDSAALLLAFLK